jgi:hypothetical protein
MKTITFYSYKGGVGRSLALANVATLLARMKRRVFCLDLDLEAPGLQYKFLRTRDDRNAIKGGVLDLLPAWSKPSSPSSGKLPDSLSQYIVNLQKVQGPNVQMWLMPAGKLFNGGNQQAYWGNLFNFSSRLGGDHSSRFMAFEFVHRLRDKLAAEYEPDFLLIDARTVVTELGGMATRELADVIVCLFINNLENFEAVTEIMRVAARRLDGASIPVVPVLSRFPTGVLGADFDSGFYEKELKVKYSRGSFEFPRPLLLHSSIGLEWQPF